MYVLKVSSYLISGYYGDIIFDLWISLMFFMVGGRLCDGLVDWGMVVYGDRGYW